MSLLKSSRPPVSERNTADEITVRRDGSVAVVMRTKDQPILLHRALASVASQTWENWHLYLVNDGGSRTTFENTVSFYKTAFGNRITLISHDISLGMEKASNAALSRASEEFAIIHDDDDSLHPEFLEETVSFLQKPEHSFFVAVTTECEVINESIEYNEIVTIKRSRWNPGKLPPKIRELIVENQFPPICMLFRRSALVHIGMYNGQLPVLGDWEFNQRLLKLGDFGHINRLLARYHLRNFGSGNEYGNSVIDGNNKHKFYKYMMDNEALRKSFQDAPYLEGAVQAILQAQHQQELIVKKMQLTLEKLLPDIHKYTQQIDRRTSRKQRRAKLLKRLRSIFGVS
jgi:glycosyltransferase involved in cell wall biosynthesis